LIGTNYPQRITLVSWLRAHKSLVSTGHFVNNILDLAKFIGSTLSGIDEAYDLIWDLKGDEEYSRIFALYALIFGWPGKSRTESLYFSSAEDNNFLLRYAAILWTKPFRDNLKTLPVVYERASNDSDGAVRSAALEALTQYYREETQTLPLLQERAIKDESPKPNAEKGDLREQVRITALNAIAKYWPTNPETLPLLRDRAENDPTPWLRERAKELIAELEGNKE
jgi:hypothetical protein